MILQQVNDVRRDSKNGNLNNFKLWDLEAKHK